MEQESNERLDLTAFNEKTEQLRQSISSVIVGEEVAVEQLLTCLIAGGHALIEGVPGVGKTMLAKLLSKLISAKYSRIQFTPDLMPSDVTGTMVFNMKTSVFDFHPGPVFADIVLADEINRAPAKTQASLFEVMEERQVTVDGITLPMGPLFTIIATENPIEQEGTYRLPEAQKDRFLMKILIDYPSVEQEQEILQRHQENINLPRLENIKPVITIDELLSLRAMLQNVVVDTSLLNYIARIVEQTRKSKAIYVGASPRASVAILLTSKATALLAGRDFVAPDDIKTVVPAVLRHRILLTAEAEMQGYTPDSVIKKMLERVEVKI